MCRICNVLLFCIAAVMQRGEGFSCRGLLMARLSNMEVKAAFEGEWKSRLLTRCNLMIFNLCQPLSPRKPRLSSAAQTEPEAGNVLSLVRKKQEQPD